MIATINEVLQWLAIFALAYVVFFIHGRALSEVINTVNTIVGNSLRSMTNRNRAARRKSRGRKR